MIELLNIDCMEYMKTCENNSFDLAIVDVPYTDNYDAMKQISVSNNARAGDYHYNSLTNAKPTDEYWKELRRVSKNQIVWGANYLIENLSSTPCVIVWDKDNTGNFADCEIAFGTFKTGAKIFKHRWNGMLQQDMKNKEERIHPTQKPKQLYKFLLETFAKPTDRILDTHLGSGSIAIACHYFGCDFVGTEIDKHYFDKAKRNYELNTIQTSLFLNEKNN